MKTNDFNFNLPEELIAQFPPEKRGQSRLLTLDRKSGKRTHENLTRLPEILCEPQFLSPLGEKPLLVFNNTKVRKARLIGKSLELGSEHEFLLIDKVVSEELGVNSVEWKAMTKKMNRKKIGNVFLFYNNQNEEIGRATVTGFKNDLIILKFKNNVDDDWLTQYGHIPLPPYIKRKDAPKDSERYQTVYADKTGSAAAPTAGLHFTRELLEEFKEKEIECVFVTLHVGLGTFLPVRSDNIEEHVMHNEKYFINEQTAKKIEEAKKMGRKIIAVGTTSLRTLESAWNGINLKKGESDTSIFIYPPFDFKVVDALFTNFHTPKSTLLMLVSAFAGRDLILETYAEAVREKYRFFSYGDAMLIY